LRRQTTARIDVGLWEIRITPLIPQSVQRRGTVDAEHRRLLIAWCRPSSRTSALYLNLGAWVISDLQKSEPASGKSSATLRIEIARMPKSV
jgi:hypothetical protein